MIKFCQTNRSGQDVVTELLNVQGGFLPVAAKIDLVSNLFYLVKTSLISGGCENYIDFRGL